MGSHSVICHPAQVNVPCFTLTPARQAGTRFTYPEAAKGWRAEANIEGSTSRSALFYDAIPDI